MSKSHVPSRLQLRIARLVPTLGSLHLNAVKASDHTEPRMVIEDNEVLLSLMEMPPDYSRCGINE